MVTKSLKEEGNLKIKVATDYSFIGQLNIQLLMKQEEF